MIVTKNMPVIRMVRWSSYYLFLILIGTCIVALLYFEKIFTFEIPLTIITIVGTAVAFYVGFKNNNAYNRMWEARTIWGGIVNSSRAWATYVDGFVDNFSRPDAVAADQIYAIKKTLIYRHIAWLYTLRKQLLVPQTWEHSAQGGPMENTVKYFQKHYGLHLFKKEAEEFKLEDYLDVDELKALKDAKNMATQIVNHQTKNLSELREQNLINDFRHVSMEKILYDFYELQGKCERIKNFPLPRQYANISRIFVIIFVSLLPFGVLPIIMNMGMAGEILAIPITILISWVYLMMEIVGDYSENPFSGMSSDIPMLALCRTIEIDLRQILQEKELPQPIKPINGILM